jgi:hypothetical protein
MKGDPLRAKILSVKLISNADPGLLSRACFRTIGESCNKLLPPLWVTKATMH